MNLGTWEAQALWAGQGQVMGRTLTRAELREVAPFPDLYLHHLSAKVLPQRGSMANIRFIAATHRGDSLERERVVSITRKARCCHDP